MAVHEGGHFFMGKVFGQTISFRFEWGLFLGKCPVPRFIWDMPVMERRKQQVVAFAGFGLEFIAAAMLFLTSWDFAAWYAIAAVIHLVTYRFYAGDASDFKWFKG